MMRAISLSFPHIHDDVWSNMNESVAFSSKNKEQVKDLELIQLLQEQNETAITTFVQQFQEPVFRICQSILFDSQDAEDATQESLMDAILHISNFHGESSLQTWLYRIATNRSLQIIRAKKRKKRFAQIISLFGKEADSDPIQVEDVHSDLEHYIENKTLSSILKKGIQQLPEQQKIAFSLVYVNEHSYQETAEIMETTVKAVESLLSRAKKTLRLFLEGKGYGKLR
jgi:RNA polymerase sigma-70 factor (ECF subfamily)